MQSKSRQQILLIVALAVVGLFVANQFVFSKVSTAWKARRAQIADLRQQLEQGKSLVDRESKIRQRWEVIRRNSFPPNTSAAEQQFFKAADRWAGESRVTITSITPQWKRESPEFITYQGRVDVSGSMQSLSRFLYEIEKDAAAVKVESIELAARDKDARQLSLALQLSALVINPVAK